jgi:hypothetical protein
VRFMAEFSSWSASGHLQDARGCEDIAKRSQFCRRGREMQIGLPPAMCCQQLAANQ